MLTVLPPIPLCQATKYTIRVYLITLFCASIVVITEKLFHSLIMMGFSDTANLGVYENVRKTYGKGRNYFVLGAID